MNDPLLLGTVGVTLLAIGMFNYGYDLAQRRLAAAFWLLLTLVGAVIVFAMLLRGTTP